MKKRIIALVLCVFMLIPLFSSCSHVEIESIIQIYLGHQVYDLDPLNAFTNDAQLKLVSLIFSGLYKVDENGKLTDDLASRTEIINDEEKNEYTIRITMKNTYWSDGSAVSSDDVLFTIRRVLKGQNSNPATALLLKVKNAREVKNGEVSIDDLGVTAPQTNVVELRMCEKITPELLDEIKLAFSSPALFPLRENYVQGKEDWAKKQSSIVCSGPFILRKVNYEINRSQFIFERNEYYFRNREKDPVDKYVTPYRLVINFSLDQTAAYEEGQLLFAGDIPLEKRSEYASKVTLKDALSTHAYYFNQNAEVYSVGYTNTLNEYFKAGGTYKKEKDKYDAALAKWNDWAKANKSEVKSEYPVLPVAPEMVLNVYTDKSIADFIESQNNYNAEAEAFAKYYGELALPEDAKPIIMEKLPEDANKVKLFSIPEVRKALSISVDRTAIANEVVFAKPATGLIGNRIFDVISPKTLFRNSAEGVVNTAADVNAAKALLSTAGIDASKYTFTIRTRACDEVHNLIATRVAESWNALGFNVTVEPIDVMINDDIDPSTKEKVEDIRDDCFDEMVVGGNNYQVLALDMVPQAPTSFAVLAPFAVGFTGNRTVSSDGLIDAVHSTGYNNEAYNELITKAFESSDKNEISTALHDAEKLLVETDNAVMPILFNCTATLISSQLNARSIGGSYYSFWYFAKTDFKQWESYRDTYFPVTEESEDSTEETPDNGEVVEPAE